MPLLRTIASGLLSRRAARRIARFIPNPIVRYAVVTAATTLAPFLIDRAVERWNGRGANPTIRGAGRSLNV